MVGQSLQKTGALLMNFATEVEMRKSDLLILFSPQRKCQTKFLQILWQKGPLSLAYKYPYC